MKRFTETTKWTVNPWFRKLPPRLKCLWQFLVDSCDAAGVIDPDWELVSFQIGEDVGPENLESFGERVEILPNGKLFITGFIAFQYGELSPTCKPHTPVFKSLLANGIERHSKGYPYPLETLEEKDKDKEREKDTDKDAADEKPPVKKSKAKGTLEELKSFAVEIELPASDGENCFHKWESTGWKGIQDWKAKMRTWKFEGFHASQKTTGKNGSTPPPPGTMMVNGRLITL